MAATQLGMAILGLEGERRRDDIVPGVIPSVPEARATRSSRRPTSNYNAYQTACVPSHDNPPSYAIATRHKPSTTPIKPGTELLPKYSCDVNAQAKMLLQLESINPLHGMGESDWREVYVVLRGTMLNFHRVKNNGPGSLLKSYTLQHAEVGLALDTEHVILIPQTKLAHLIPTSARRKAWSKDTSLYKAAKQTVARLRLETDQILIADGSEDLVCDMLNAISAGIDISISLDERTIPRQCTVPRRRRRQPRITNSADLNDPALIADQERILREMFPTFAAQRAEANERRAAQRTESAPTVPQIERSAELQRTITADSAVGGGAADATQGQARDEDDLDLAVMREDFAAPGAAAPQQTSQRPGYSRQTTATSVSTTMSDNMIYSTNPSNFTPEAKWQPPNARTPAQAQRYARRCMPILLADAARASDVMICHGKRVKINWRMEMLEEWALSPPTYRSHGFKKAQETGPQQPDAALLQRSKSTSTNSQAPSSGSPRTSRSVLGRETEPSSDAGEHIEPAETAMASLELTKVTSATKEARAPSRAAAARPSVEVKRQEARRGEEVHGVVVCF